MDLLNGEFYGNSTQAWLVAAGVAVVTFLFLRFIAFNVVGRLAKAARKSEYRWDDIVTGALKATRSLPLLIIALFAGATTLTLDPRHAGLLGSVTVIALLIQGGLWLSAGLTRFLEERGKAKAEEDPAEVMTMNVIGVATKLALWSMVLLLALDNMGVDVTALVAGLGIGGVAVALAAQSILGDLFASLSIVLDKPFVLGDFLVIGDFLGVVESIGLKTTRVRSLSGEQVVFSNNDLLSSRIRNYGRMYERRVVLNIGVTYQTPRETLRTLPGIIRAAIEALGEDRARFDRAHMSQYGDFAIGFEAVYFVLSPDFNLHMDIKQDIMLRIHEEFERVGAEFAYPTQTLFLERSGADVDGASASGPGVLQ